MEAGDPRRRRRDRARFARDAAFLVGLALSPFADGRALARELFLLADPASFKATFVSNTTSLTLVP